MNEGRLQQMGTPDDIYERPANRFVAEFVGAPPINIMELSGDMTPLARFARGFLTQSLPQVTDATSIGIRPEALRILTGTATLPDGQFSVPATVSGVLPTGGSWIIELQAAGQALFMTTHVAPTLQQGETVTVAMRPSALHLFDANGLRLSDADPLLAQLAA
jgi:iron(III) transport system ATP-binding protein